MRTWLRGKITLLFMTFGLLLAVPAIALADNAISDGDGPVPLADSNMAFGDVACNVASNKTALIAINRNGNGTQVFKDGSKVTVTVLSVTGTGLTATMDASPAEITLPSNWALQDNNTKSASVSSKVTVNSSVAGAGTGTVTYQATGVNSSNATITREDTMNVSWTTGSCTPPDSTAPSVTSIKTADANPTNTTGNLKWNVTFSESVTGVDASDFALANTGLGGTPAILAQPDGVSGSGASYTVTASSGTGDGKLGLNLTDNDSIVDGASNKLGGTNPGNGDFTGEVYVIDRTAPTATGSAVLGPAFTDPYTANTWTNQSVRVTFACTDNTGGSGLTSTSGNQTLADFTTNTSVSGATATFSGTCTDNAGNTAAAANFGPIKIDKDNPTIALGAVSGTTGTNGWYKSPVTQAFNATDVLSGLVGPANFSKSSGANEEGANVMIASGEVSDNAGNTTSRSAGPFMIDLSDPTITASLNPQDPASSGWYNGVTGAPTVSFNCSDAVSGLATGACPANHTFANGEDQSHSGTVTDKAGRSATAGVSNVDVDLDPPSAPNATTNPASPVANSGDFFKDTVTVSYGGSTDVGPSGVKGYSNAETFNTTGPHNYSGKATDNAGNESTATTGQVKVDADAPTVGITGCPTSPVTLSSNQSINVTASDEANGSGLASDPSGSLSLDTGSVGSKTMTVTATDKVGHNTSKSCNYSVNYGFSGFLQPINWTAHQVLDTNVSTFKAGSTVPVKFYLTDANGNRVQPATAPQWTVPQKGSATTQAVDEGVFTEQATNGTTYRWDSTAQQFIYNWGTKGVAANFYYKIGVKLDDGQTYYTYISLR